MDYTGFQARLSGMPHAEAVEFCRSELPSLWATLYDEMTDFSAIHAIALGSHHVLFDLAGDMGDDDAQESRVVAAYGVSTAPNGRRDAHRMRGYLGKTRDIYGGGYDKGHYIAHAMGGDDLDAINWFPQETALNRGRSPQGKLYRDLERRCAAAPGSFFFSRPLYDGPSVWPHRLEIGLLVNGRMEIHQFDNIAPDGPPRFRGPNDAPPEPPRTATRTRAVFKQARK